jgi:hypothetical protein
MVKGQSLSEPAGIWLSPTADIFSAEFVITTDITFPHHNKKRYQRVQVPGGISAEVMQYTYKLSIPSHCSTNPQNTIKRDKKIRRLIAEPFLLILYLLFIAVLQYLARGNLKEKPGSGPQIN